MLRLCTLGRMAESCNYTLASDFLKLYLSQDHADVTFAFGDNGNLHAHKSILAARVLRFKELFSGKSGTLTFDVSEVGITAFDAFLRFVYSGRLPEGQSNLILDQLLVIAEEFDVPPLFCHCQIIKMVAILSEMPADTKLENLIPAFKKVLALSPSSSVKIACEKELAERVELAWTDISSWTINDSTKRRSTMFIDNMIDIIVLSKTAGWNNLRMKSVLILIRFRQTWKMNVEILNRLWKLKDNPDLFVEMINFVIHKEGAEGKEKELEEKEGDDDDEDTVATNLTELPLPPPPFTVRIKQAQRVPST